MTNPIPHYMYYQSYTSLHLLPILYLITCITNPIPHYIIASYTSLHNCFVLRMGRKAGGPVSCVMHVKQPRTLIVKEKGLAPVFPIPHYMYYQSYTSLHVLPILYLVTCITNHIPHYMYYQSYTSLHVLPILYLVTCITNPIPRYMYYQSYTSSCNTNPIPRHMYM